MDLYVLNKETFLTDKVLTAKALSLNKEIRTEFKEENAFMSGFKASNGWLYKFKKNNGIVSKQCLGESFEVNKDDFTEFITLFISKFIEYGRENIFNCDETGLFYKLCAQKSLVSRARNNIKKIKI
ncbi:Tigger transposable element-derived protein 6 [Dictyocoela muelleri]|nr:Tigger transposable element-derived protein 6 [Dictyocoela muelleri]